MDTEDTGINFSRLAILGVLATFTGLRRFVGLVGLLGLVWAGVLALTHAAPVSVNTNPICNRVAYLTFEQQGNGPPWGQKIYAENGARYYREANGTGYCLVKHDDKAVLIQDPIHTGGVWKYKYYEVPTKYGTKVQEIVPPDVSREQIAFFLALASLGVLVGLWAPATIMAMVAKRWVKNIHQTE